MSAGRSRQALSGRGVADHGPTALRSIFAPNSGFIARRMITRTPSVFAAFSKAGSGAGGNVPRTFLKRRNRFAGLDIFRTTVNLVLVSSGIDAGAIPTFGWVFCQASRSKTFTNCEPSLEIHLASTKKSRKILIHTVAICAGWSEVYRARQEVLPVARVNDCGRTAKFFGAVGMVPAKHFYAAETTRHETGCPPGHHVGCHGGCAWTRRCFPYWWQEPVGFTSEAEGFVFLSAVLAGRVYGGSYLRGDWKTMAKLVWKRARLVYAVYVGRRWLVVSLGCLEIRRPISAAGESLSRLLLHPWTSLALVPVSFAPTALVRHSSPVCADAGRPTPLFSEACPPLEMEPGAGHL